MDSINQKKECWCKIVVALVFLESAFIIASVLLQTQAILWFLVAVNLLTGPLCIFFYVREIRSGTFKED